MPCCRDLAKCSFRAILLVMNFIDVSMGGILVWFGFFLRASLESGATSSPGRVCSLLTHRTPSWVIIGNSRYHLDFSAGRRGDSRDDGGAELRWNDMPELPGRPLHQLLDGAPDFFAGVSRGDIMFDVAALVVQLPGQ